MNKAHKPIGRPALKSFVDSIGGPSHLLTLIEGFYAVMARDAMIGFYFEGRDLKHTALRQSEFILFSAGLLKEYEGRPPHRAHDKVAPILPGFFDRRMVILDQYLEAAGVTESQRKTLVDFERGFRPQIVVGNPP